MTTRDVIERCSFLLPENRSDRFVRLVRGFELNAEDSSGKRGLIMRIVMMIIREKIRWKRRREGGCGGGNGKD